MIWIGVIIVVVAVIAIIKQYDSRTILFLSGLLMCIVSGTFLPAFDKFFTNMFTTALTQQICSAMGYATVMGYTKCDWHLATWLVGLLKKAQAIVIPGSIIAIAIVIFAIGSNASTAAAVGPVFIPVMIKAGVHPAMAATAACMGAAGSWFYVGNAHTLMIAAMSGDSVVKLTFGYNFPVGGLALILMIIWAVIYAKRHKEGSGYVDASDQFKETEQAKINPYKAFLPFLPVIVILLSAFKVIPVITVQQTMLLCALWAMITLRVSPAGGVQAFASGLGRGIAEVMSIIACAGVFTLGLEKVGITPALITVMKSNPGIAVYSAAIATWFIGFLCGSGDAPTLAFNQAITPLVGGMGLDIGKIGTIAQMGGSFGRTMSPVAGVTIICAGLAKVSPIEVTKRIWPPIVVSVVLLIVMMGFIL